jgi:acyl-coenzyme A thioesterase PaaI-like protein
MYSKPIQHYYPEDVSHCYGCGHLNEYGYRIETYWDGKQSITRFSPKPYHTAIPGVVYGGLIASLIDCHGTGTAAAAMADKRKIDVTKSALPRFVTASLQVNYRKPTPIGTELTITGEITEITDRKVIIAVQLAAGQTVCADGTVISVELRST